MSERSAATMYSRMLSARGHGACRASRRLAIKPVVGALCVLLLSATVANAAEHEEPKDPSAKDILEPGVLNGTFDVWVTGTLSPRARQELGERGYTILERVDTRVEILD